jgi:hypothetical protein
MSAHPLHHSLADLRWPDDEPIPACIETSDEPREADPESAIGRRWARYEELP